MSYFEQFAPAALHRVLVDITEFTRPWLTWRAGIERQIQSQEKQLDGALEAARSLGEEVLEADLTAAIQSAGESPLDFAAYLPLDRYPEARRAGEAIQELRRAEYSGPGCSIQWAEASTAGASMALKNSEVLARRHPEWDQHKIGLVSFMAVYHAAQPGEPSPGELYETFASKAEHAQLWRYLQTRFLEEFPEMSTTHSGDLKNVFCGRALNSELAGTPQS